MTLEIAAPIGALKTITVTCQGVNGTAEATFPFNDWIVWNPLRRVLALHDALRSTLAGQRFDIIRQTYA